MNIAVIGYSGDAKASPVFELRDLCYALGAWIGSERHRLWSGGRDGVMELVSQAAQDQGATTIGVLPYDRSQPGIDPNPWLDLPIFTGLDYQMRSLILLQNAECVISVGGQCGTALEIIAAYSYSKPLFLMKGTGGWTDRMALIFAHHTQPVFLDQRALAPVWIADGMADFQTLFHREFPRSRS